MPVLCGAPHNNGYVDHGYSIGVLEPGIESAIGPGEFMRYVTGAWGIGKLAITVGINTVKGGGKLGAGLAGSLIGKIGGRASSKELLGQPITWKAKDLKRVISNHGPNIGGKGGNFKSRFFEGVDIPELIKSGTHHQAVKQIGSKNLKRVFEGAIQKSGKHS